VEAAALLRRATSPVPNATKRHKRHLKGVQNRQVWAIRNMVSVLNAGTGQFPEPQAAPQFKKLPQFKTGTNISRTKTFKNEPKRGQFRTPLPPLGPLSRVQPANNPENHFFHFSLAKPSPTCLFHSDSFPAPLQRK
jgi:hypothetical protein